MQRVHLDDAARIASEFPAFDLLNLTNDAPYFLMTQSHHDQIAKALELLVQGLQPFLERELQGVYGDGWVEAVHGSLRTHRESAARATDGVRWDAAMILIVMADLWHAVFRVKLTPLERSLVSELREFRNRWAHQGVFDNADTFRVLDSVQRLLSAVGAPQANELTPQKEELLRQIVQESDDEVTRARKARVQLLTRVSISILCGVAIIFQAVMSFGSQSFTFSALVAAVFTYIVVQQVTSSRVSYGVRECRRCGKVIYRQPCPYCEDVRGT